MIRGVAELFGVLFPALDDFPGNLEDSALALILGSEHPEGFIRLNLTAAEAGDFLRTAFFIPDLGFRNHRGIKGIFVLAGHLHNLLKISKIGTFHDGCFRADPLKEIVHNGPVDNGKVIIQIRQLFDIGTLALPAGFPFFITKRPGRNNDVIVHILLIHLLKFIKFKAHPGSLLPLPTQIVQHFKIFIPAKFDQNTICVALDDFTMIFQPFNQIQKKKLTAHTNIVGLPGVIHGIVLILHSAIGAVQNNLVRLLHGVLLRLQLQAGVIDFRILGRIVNITGKPLINQHQRRVIGSHIHIDKPTFPVIFGNGPVKATPSEHMGNPGHIQFKGFGIITVQGVLVPIQNFRVFFDPQAGRELNFKFIIVFPLNGPKDFGGKLCFGSANVRNGKVERLHK